MKYHGWNFVTFLLLFMELSVMIVVQAARTKDPFYIIAHMVNSRKAVDWAVSQGANGIENDLQFDGNGNPTIFEHGSPCDCACGITGGNICREVYNLACSGPQASDDAAEHMQQVARVYGIGLYIIDSKVEAKWGDRLMKAGSAVIPFIDKNLFAHGYQGKVVIGSGKIETYDYIQAAVIAAKISPNRDRYFFTFDQEGDNYFGVMDMLSRLTNNRVYGTGISSCVPQTFYTGILYGVVGKLNGEHGLTYIWSIDSESSMLDYIDRGVQGIMTNRVGLAHQVVMKLGLPMAKAFASIPVATLPMFSQQKCDCNYHPGGCMISWPAPSGKACKCEYDFIWTCGGSLVFCDYSNTKCANPDASKAACLLGGGDCGGY